MRQWWRLTGQLIFLPPAQAWRCLHGLYVPQSHNRYCTMLPSHVLHRTVLQLCKRCLQRQAAVAAQTFANACGLLFARACAYAVGGPATPEAHHCLPQPPQLLGLFRAAALRGFSRNAAAHQALSSSSYEVRFL